ncbi:MAG TPA: hypothetical protein VJ813_15900 [Vicinamibacterales bacterium]|nr:hypothetical protein [Vicinamibacterales bacterium]
MLEDTRVFDAATLQRISRSPHPECVDWGRPGYTLGVTPHPDNEGIFTALGRIVGGMDVVERLEPGDVITAARMVR